MSKFPFVLYSKYFVSGLRQVNSSCLVVERVELVNSPNSDHC